MDTINYSPSAAERREIAKGLMVPLEQVPHELTQGVRCPSWQGVRFAERVSGQHVALFVPRHAGLAAAMRRAADARKSRAA